MEIKREDLLKNPVKDMKINKNTTLMQLMEMFSLQFQKATAE